MLQFKHVLLQVGLVPQIGMLMELLVIAIVVLMVFFFLPLCCLLFFFSFPFFFFLNAISGLVFVDPDCDYYYHVYNCPGGLTNDTDLLRCELNGTCGGLFFSSFTVFSS